MLKRIFLYLATIVSIASSSSCQEKNTIENIQYVMQPEVEIGKEANFYVRFNVKPDSVWAETYDINGLELTDDLFDLLKNIRENNSTDSSGKVIDYYYDIYTYAKPTKLGKIDFPILTMSVNGKEYKSNPFSINVVEKLRVGADAIQMILSSDKDVYHLKDTIKINLYDYSKFSKTQRKNLLQNPLLTGKENTIKIEGETTIDDISGITDFENYFKKNFELIDYHWNFFQNHRSVENINGINYIKTMIFTATLLPKNKGKFKIGPSSFEYFIYKSSADYLNKFVPNDHGSYTVTDTGSTKLIVTSKALEFKVK